MFKNAALIVAFAAFLSILIMSNNLRKNIQKAKRSGLPYIIGPFAPLATFFLILAELSVFFSFIPGITSCEWYKLMDPQSSWRYARSVEEKFGDTFILVTPFTLYLKTSNAELVTQITTRRTHFVKPVERYKAVDAFGGSILTQEGNDWKRHKKIVGPSFSEKSNKLVFEESVRQAEGLMSFWASSSSNTTEDIKVSKTAHDAATLSFHVICAAGFGLPQLWPNDNTEKFNGRGIPGFNDSKLINGHTLSFKTALVTVLEGLVWLALLPRPLLKISPFMAHKRVYQAFLECNAYFEDLFEAKQKHMYLGDDDTRGTMDLLGPMIKANYELAPSDSKYESSSAFTLSKTEILGNSFIFFFAGHETTGNNISYSMLYLAIFIAAQKHMQADIDSIVGGKSCSEYSYHNDMPRLFNSLVGAVIHEELRLIPALLYIPKDTKGDQIVSIDGKQYFLPDKTPIHINVTGTQRNPRYWREAPNEFVPERWLPKQSHGTAIIRTSKDTNADGTETASFEMSSYGSLMIPVKGSFIPFSDGARSCPGKRFAQVEATAVLSTIFRKYSVELDVSDWATDDEVESMGKQNRRELYEKAIKRAKEVIARSEQTITIQLKQGDTVPLRFVQRGRERFHDIF